MGMIISSMLMVVFLTYHLYRILEAKPRPLPYKDQPILNGSVPLVSFLVPAWNDQRHISGFIEAFNALTYPNKELILCVGGQDGSLEYAQQFASKTIIVVPQNAGEGKQKALKKSYPLSHGEILYLTDIDCRLTDPLVFHMIHLLMKNEVVVTGPSDPLSYQRDKPLVRVQWAVDRATESPTCSTTTGILGRNAALRRSVLDMVGAFNESVPSGTDYFLAKKLLECGQSIMFVPYARIDSEYPETLSLYIRKQARWIRNVFALGQKFHEHQEVLASLVTLAIPVVTVVCIVSGLATIIFGVPFWSWLLGLTAIILILHPLFNRIRYLKMYGAHVPVQGVLEHWLGTSIASVRAGWQVMMNSWVW